VTVERPRATLSPDGSMDRGGSLMKLDPARLGSAILALTTLALGVLWGRVIEAIAAAAVLAAIWTYLVRLFSTPDEGMPGHGMGGEGRGT
jgi:hypothetical protein